MSTRLIGNLPHLDTIICNAAYGNVIGVDWAKAIWETVTDLFTSVTYPTFKLTTVGETTAPQSNSNKSLDDGGKSLGGDPPLGKVFTSNVFGHYILSHSLIPLLTASPDHGRIIFVSSIEPLKSDFNPADIQALSSPRAYESSKRLTDILALTSNLPSTKPFVRRFLTSSPSTTPRSIPILDKDGQSDTGPDTPPTRITMSDNEYRPPSTVYPNIYLTHPGIIATAIVALSLFPFYARILVFYIARWLGSPWHPVTPYKGACAPVWLALADKAGLEELELRDGKGKWGSVCSRMGHEKVMRTEVEGWGLGGRRGEGDLSKRWGKRKGIEQATEEDRLQFEELGRDCWRQMEELRAQWEERTRG